LGNADARPDSYLSDPADPVPYRARPIPAMTAPDSTWDDWLVDDQSPFGTRPDVKVWKTVPLKRSVAIIGNVKANLYAATTGTDADWIVKLIDVYPDEPSVPGNLRGKEIMIANEVLRARYRNGFQVPEALKSGDIVHYTIDLHAASHVFLPGHRIAVQVQSTWFPLIDRNPQTFVPSIYRATAESYQKATQTIYHSAPYASEVSVVLEDAADRQALPGGP
jgi:putative CocE/NonD family hydrolase